MNGLGKLVERVEELPSGYALVFATTAYTRNAIDEFIAFEQHCCAFMTYTLVHHSPEQLTLELIGPEGTKQFLASWIDKWDKSVT